MADKDEEKMQQLFMQMQMLKEQLETAAKEKGMLDEKTKEIILAKRTIQEIKKVKPKSETWAPIGAGSYVKTEIKDTKNIAIGVGAGVVAMKKIDDAVKILDKREKELDVFDRALVGNIEELQKVAASTEAEMQGLLQKAQQAGKGN